MTGATHEDHARAGATTPWRQWLIVLVVTGAVALSLNAVAASDETDTSDTADTAAGRELYTTNCAMCHGPDGGGGAVRNGRPAAEGRPVPPIDDSTVSEIRLVLETGRMPPAGNPFNSQARSDELSPEQRDAIVDYVSEEFDLEGDVPPPPEGDPARGQELYATNCAACHGSTGGGGVAGRGAFTPALTEYDPQTIADAVRTGPFEMPQFGPEQLTDDEIGHIAAFLDHVEHEQFALLWGAELGPVYASAFALALVAVVLLLTVVIAGRPMWFPSPRRKPDDTEADGVEPNHAAPGGAEPGDEADRGESNKTESDRDESDRDESEGR